MAFLDEISEDFDPDVQERGAAYHAQGRVKILSATPEKVVARVQGTESYKVSWEASDERIGGSCNCEYFKDRGPCKHLWAVAMEADARGLFRDIEVVPEIFDEDAVHQVYDVLSGLIPQKLRSRVIDSIAPAKAPQKKEPGWKSQLSTMKGAMRSARPVHVPERPPLAAGRRLIYVIDHDERYYAEDSLVVELHTQPVDRAGAWARPRELRMTRAQIPLLPDEQDRLIVQMLAGVDSGGYARGDSPLEVSHSLKASDFPLLLRSICDTGRCFVRSVSHVDDETYDAVTWDEGPPYELVLQCTLSPGGSFYFLNAVLRRGDDTVDCREPVMILEEGIAVMRSRVARIEHFGAFPIIEYFRRFAPELKLPRADADAALGELLTISPLPKLDLAPELSIQTVSPPLRPRLKIVKPPKKAYDGNRLVGKLSFDYDGRVIAEQQSVPVFDPATRTLLKRDTVGEAAARMRLDQLKFKESYDYYERETLRRLAPSKLNSVVMELCAEGWLVEAEGRLYRRGGEFKIDVSSGIDWFELNGSMDFGGISATLPRLLAALKKGEKTIQLGDGTIGILPEEWLKKYGLLAKVAKTSDEQVRFSRGQIGLLDAMLADVPMARYDQVFEEARQLLRSFDGIAPMDPAQGFTGTLRPYQRQGLGWLNFLNRFGFGGCLADDMGLGKTIQVLSLLQSRMGKGKSSLVVVPRSLIFNWVEEAKRFAPDLRVLDHSGVARTRGVDHLSNYDIILTTYGTLRLDAPILKDFQFDYVVLDEAQAIKNASSESAKAARLIRADHRLAMSGTPVQNHLGELWSLFEFLNPGMLGAASVFKMTGKGNGLDQESRTLLSRALRPFILRRTKEQVASDLPEKTEQTIHCDMEPEQRKVYDELKEHYRASLLKRIETEGINKAKIQILEALLRLRQAACHPGLIDESWIDKPAAKLDAMIPQLCEVLEEGHKVLIFSQFTSMLAILKHHLDKRKIVYEYLDGQTRDRQARVNRFQTDPDCKLFLISLKAGGLGLNLTAAEYVFLLDPWWNPAIEAQAIDRAHRIGQTRRVFAYRFIASNTVEQKVLELQSRKKDLADMIINADNSLIGQLGRDDLELLLS